MKKLRQETNKNLETQVRHLGVILENMDSKLDLAAEGHRSLDKKIEDFRDDVNTRFNEVDFKFGVVLDELQVIHNELKEKVGRDEFVILEKRVFNLEKKMAAKAR